MIVTCNDCAGTGGSMVEGDWRDCSNCEGTGQYEKRVRPRRQPHIKGRHWYNRKPVPMALLKAKVARMLHDQGAWPDNFKPPVGTDAAPGPPQNNQ